MYDLGAHKTSPLFLSNPLRLYLCSVLARSRRWPLRAPFLRLTVTAPRANNCRSHRSFARPRPRRPRPSLRLPVVPLISPRVARTHGLSHPPCSTVRSFDRNWNLSLELAPPESWLCFDVRGARIDLRRQRRGGDIGFPFPLRLRCSCTAPSHP